MVCKLPVRTLRQTARAGTQHANGASLFGARIATHPLSTQSAPSCHDRVQQTVDQHRMSQPFIPWTHPSATPDRPVVNAKPTQTEQFVWLAKQSLAASQMRKGGGVKAAESERIAIEEERQEVANLARPSYHQAWDGPTVWAHLW